MMDIYLGFVFILCLSAIVFCAGILIPRHRLTCNCIALVTFCGIVIYFQFLWYNVSLTRLLPFSNLIVVGNWFPVAGAMLAAMAWRLVPGGLIRRGISPLALLLASSIALTAPFWGSSPKCNNNWTRDGICLQTTRYTCTPACAATLLRLHGIEATEQEMAELCVTRKGTSWLGLYRGLKMKTRGTSWDVEIVQQDLNKLRGNCSTPMILTVGLDDTAEFEASFRDEKGWIPGVDHSVILLGFLEPQYVSIADPTPTVGREIWHKSELEKLWRGYGLRLVSRKPTA